MSAWYEPGNQVALVHDDRAVILPAGAAPALLDVLWSVLCGSADLVDLTAAVASHGLRSLPDIAIVVDLDGPHPRALLRGGARLEAGATVHGADGAALWKEVELKPGQMRLHMGDEPTGEAMPVLRAVVRVASLTWSEHRPSGRFSEPPLPAPSAPESAWSGPGGSPLGDGATGPAAPDDVEAAAPPSLAAGVHESPAHAGPPEPPRDASLTETLTVDDVLPPQAGGKHAALARPEDEAEDPGAIAAGADASSAETGSSDDENDYDRLFGATEHLQRRALHDHATVLTPEADIDSAPELGSPRPPSPAEPEPPEAMAPSELPSPDGSEPRDDAAPTGAGLISLVPLAGGSQGTQPINPELPTAQAPAQPAATAAALTPKDVRLDAAAALQPLDMTVSRASLAAPKPQGPLVHAVRCPAGHPNPAEAVTCRQCGTEVPPQSAITVPRPPLGALVLVSGPSAAPSRVPLDGALVLGRRPQVDRVTSVVPRLIEVPSPESDLSRNHLRVGIEGWHVLVTDLNSTNGTVITVPDEEPQRLRAGEPTLIPPGTLLVLADVVSYRFEVGG